MNEFMPLSSHCIITDYHRVLATRRNQRWPYECTQILFQICLPLKS